MGLRLEASGFVLGCCWLPALGLEFWVTNLLRTISPKFGYRSFPLVISSIWFQNELNYPVLGATASGYWPLVVISYSTIFSPFSVKYKLSYPVFKALLASPFVGWLRCSSLPLGQSPVEMATEREIIILRAMINAQSVLPLVLPYIPQWFYNSLL